MSQTLRALPLSPTAVIPERSHAGDAGFDLVSDVEITIRPGGQALVGTGIAIALPTNTVGLVCPRSGLASKHGITVLNAPGIIDESYRGEVKVILVNHSNDHFRVRCGDRIAQLVIVPYLAPTVEIVDELEATVRGYEGFGSTGFSTAAAA
ncbi:MULTISPECIES: dUTP diphosphatase [Microbacterium]|uniref:dUTP diphosphatase n=1 Tax=Microbacterium hominis TaxID=162426 RepID=A0A2K9DQT6_9MICO|nr:MULTISPECIES: dUTP diphosphatase [Microbacterium]AUG29586.1 dUTP diphosphatase [Microbacterium hominis]EPD84296.1 dUTP diphosphatase [Microbacterium sp. oral taxon 186 str. F0373]